MFILFLCGSSQLHITFVSYLNLNSVKIFIDNLSGFVPYLLDLQQVAMLLLMASLRTFTLPWFLQPHHAAVLISILIPNLLFIH